MSGGLVALVTGGGTGIGAAAAERLVADGYRVVITGRREGPLADVAARIGALPLVGDMTDSASVSRVVDATLEAYGQLDVVVANAGGHGFSSVTETDDDAWRASLDANLTTAFTVCRRALPELVRSGGAIVVMSSLAGLRAGPAVAGYTVGKHALVGLTRSMARDFGPQGVRVNAVCPGWVRTPMADSEMDELAEATGGEGREQAYALVTENVPLRRAAEPAEIAGVVAFLASKDAGYITGATIVADGGAHIVDVPTLAFDALGQ